MTSSLPTALSLEVFAELNARVAGGESRAGLLASSSIAEAQFEAAQEFWLGRMAEEAGRQQSVLAKRYGELFAAAQQRLSVPKEPARRVWRMAAPAKVALVMPGVPERAPAPALPASPNQPPLPYAARLTIEQFAALRAELVLAPASEHAAVHGRFGLEGAAFDGEEAYWQHQLAVDKDLLDRYLRQFRYCKALLQPR